MSSYLLQTTFHRKLTRLFCEMIVSYVTHFPLFYTLFMSSQEGSSKELQQCNISLQGWTRFESFIKRSYDYNNTERNKMSIYSHAGDSVRQHLGTMVLWLSQDSFSLSETQVVALVPGKECPIHDLCITTESSVVSLASMWMSHWKTSCPLPPALLWQPSPAPHHQEDTSAPRPEGGTGSGPGSFRLALRLPQLAHGRRACVCIRPLQLIQNAAAWLILNLPRFPHATPLLHTLHWLPVAAQIHFKAQVLAFSATNGSGLSCSCNMCQIALWD